MNQVLISRKRTYAAWRLALAAALLGHSTAGFGADVCPPRIDFETDDSGNALVSGQTIDDEWGGWGITASFTVNAPATGPLMIFDSSNPTGGDVDLGSPNYTCVAPGPGVGTWGELGQPGENCFPQDKILIVSEDGDGSDPDDAMAGGTITFSFDKNTRIEALEFLDAEYLGSVELLDESAQRIFYNIPIAPGDNAYELLAVNTGGARSLAVTFPAEGALGAIDFCLGSIRDKVWLDSNDNGLFDVGEQGISAVTVSLLKDPDGVPETGDESVVATTVTDADGNFGNGGWPQMSSYEGFDGLEDGDYIVLITDTAGGLSDLLATTDLAEAGGLSATITGGDDVIGINFGYVGDEDNDGVSDFRDRCPQTMVGDLVDANGCEAYQAASMVLAEISTLIDSPVSDKARDKLSKAQDKMGESLAALDQGDVKKALKKIGDAAKELIKAEKEGADVADLVNQLVELARAQAQTAIDEAVTADGDPKDIDKANREISKALEELAKGKPDKAIDKYANAWDHANKA